MPTSDSQTFLRELDKKLRTSADKLRSNLDAAVYNHAVPTLTKGSTDIPVCSSPSKKGNTDIPVCSSAHEEAIRPELEEPHYYIVQNVFRLPALARWKTLQDCHPRMRSCKMRSHPTERPRSGGYSAKLPARTEFLRERGFATRSYKTTSTGKLIDDALKTTPAPNFGKSATVADRRYGCGSMGQTQQFSPGSAS